MEAVDDAFEERVAEDALDAPLLDNLDKPEAPLFKVDCLAFFVTLSPPPDGFFTRFPWPFFVLQRGEEEEEVIFESEAPDSEEGLANEGLVAAKLIAEGLVVAEIQLVNDEQLVDEAMLASDAKPFVREDELETGFVDAVAVEEPLLPADASLVVDEEEVVPMTESMIFSISVAEGPFMRE